jgi:hypothetical protein
MYKMNSDISLKSNMAENRAKQQMEAQVKSAQYLQELKVQEYLIKVAQAERNAQHWEAQ